MSRKSLKLLIITVFPNAAGSKLLREAGVSLSLDVIALSPQQVMQKPELAEGVGIVIPRFMPKTVKSVVEACKVVRNTNPEAIFAVDPDLILSSFDKWLTFEALEALSIPTPRSFLLTEGSLEEVCAELGSRFIIKPRIGNRGMGVRLHEMIMGDPVELVTGSYVAQRFLKLKAGNDVRAFVVGDEVVGSMLRRSVKGEIVTNLANGGTGSKYLLDDASSKLAVKAAKVFGASYAGVDLMWSDEGDLQILEVNGSPGFKISEVIDIDIPSKVLENLITTFNK